MPATTAPTMQITCPQCGKQLRVPASAAGKRGRCSTCQTVMDIPYPQPVEEEPVMAEVAPQSFDDDLTEYRVLAAPPPPPTPTAMSPFSPYAPPAAANPKVYDGAFGMEKRALDAGVLGGLGLMALAVVWFVVGLAFDYIFFYPPILFLIGLVGMIRGLFKGS